MGKRRGKKPDRNPKARPARDRTSGTPKGVQVHGFTVHKVHGFFTTVHGRPRLHGQAATTKASAGSFHPNTKIAGPVTSGRNTPSPAERPGHRGSAGRGSTPRKSPLFGPLLECVEAFLTLARPEIYPPPRKSVFHLHSSPRTAQKSMPDVANRVSMPRKPASF